MATISPPSAAPGDPYVLRAHVGVGAAVRGYWFVVALLAVLLGGLGVAYGLYRSPTYEATAENVVQAFSPSVAQLPGALQAAQDLTSNQSRLIDSDRVVGPVARELETTAEYVRANVSATPVPDSTVIRIDAEAPSAADAVALANAAARKFAAFVNAQVRTEADGDEVLEQYEAASAAYQRALATKQGVDRAGDAVSPSVHLRATSAVDAAQLRREALSAQYQTVVQSRASAPTVRTFVAARSADSDRWPTLQLYAFGGALAGLMIGAALATLLANRRARRVVG